MLPNRLLFSVLTSAGLALATVSLAPARPAPSSSPAVVRLETHRSLGAGEPQAAGVRLIPAPDGNEARYRIREQLVGMELPYDAVGRTSDVTGAIVIGADGRIVADQSRIVVGMTRLTSDKERRDGFVQRRLLETERHPSVELMPTAVRGLSGPLPRTGARTFELIGNLRVRGVTRPTVWRVTAQFQGDRVVGTATTRFTFADFDLTQPRVPVVLSLADTIGLEYDFNWNREPAATR